MQPITRRAVLGGLLATPLLAACAGFDTSGAAAPGTVGFLSAPRAAASRGGRDVLLGVRPENITVDSADGDVSARVEVLEPTGSAVLLTVAVGDETLKVAAPATFRARPGEIVHLTFPPEAVRLYDAETHALCA